LYRQLREDYFNRVEAIDFAVAHDDGKRPDDLQNAEIVLIGPSRVGKTPLSMYLSVQGWKVANVPLVREIQPPKALFKIRKSRIVGLKIDPGQLIFHRKRRQQRLGVPALSDYSDPHSIAEEVNAARRFYKKEGFPAVDVTDRPIEDTAEEIIGIIKRRNRIDGKTHSGSDLLR
jgi:regulator of PEP synthase PpsR (kinase-PPPase family)